MIKLYIITIVLFLSGCDGKITVQEEINHIPYQKDIAPKSIKLKDAEIQKIAEYKIDAIVLSKKEYSDKMSDLVPIDLALGWGPMSKQELINKLNISQSGRWFYFFYKEGIDVKDVSENSANTHIIPLTNDILEKIEDLDIGSKVTLKGYLVNLKYNALEMKSSTSRNDLGSGSCEVMLVQEVI